MGSSSSLSNAGVSRARSADLRSRFDLCASIVRREQPHLVRSPLHAEKQRLEAQVQAALEQQTSRCPGWSISRRMRL
jgi:hypothetical protein